MVPAYAYIGSHDVTRHGRNIVMALKNHYDGQTLTSRTKQGEYDDIDRASYSGEKMKWTFENYVNVHTTAHLVSSENGEIISESKKVENFLKEIAMSSPEMSAGK